MNQNDKQFVKRFAELEGYELFHDLFRRAHVNQKNDYHHLREAMAGMGMTLRIIQTKGRPLDILHNEVKLPEGFVEEDVVAKLSRGYVVDSRVDQVLITTAVLYVTQ